MGKLVLKEVVLIVGNIALWSGLSGYALGILVGATSITGRMESRARSGEMILSGPAQKALWDEIRRDLIHERIARRSLELMLFNRNDVRSSTSRNAISAIQH